MKRLYTSLLSLFVLLIISTQVNANKVVVKGTVKFSNGAVAVNWPVMIGIDTLVVNTSCKQSHVVYTNANGFYSDTLSCSTANIVKVRIATQDCNRAYIIHDPQVPPGNVVESNFVICTPIVNTCEVAFTAKRDTNSLVVRYSSANAHGSSATDKITRRRWKFGDGDTLGGNIVEPAHTYSKKGSYQTCLTIWTSSGCENTVCKTVSVSDSVAPPPPSSTARCASKFVYETLPTGAITGTSVRFNSNSSTVPVGDSIRERIWKFGDGSTAHTISPVHVYTAGGTYNVCLIIRSKGGCSDTSCLSVKIPVVNSTACRSNFSFVADGGNVKFNSNISTSGAGDSIVSRQWIFGDSSAIGTTRDPSHKYTKSGNYNVCLYIKTKGGCESKECKQVNVTIPATPVIACRANFSTIADGATLKFNSSNSNGGAGDSIISRQWIFGDSSAIGTTVDPSHKYAKSGVYNVCLYIKTKGGCESKECKQVSVTVPTTSPTLTKCAAQFTSTRVSPKKIIFNSSTSLVATNDTIVERSWGFGDGSATLTGNIIKPAKEFSKAGIYTVCLKIKTAKGCNNSYCSTIRIEDTATAPVATTDPVKIISVRPNPVVSPLTTEVWSKFNNITAELSVYDIYGTKKVSLSKVLLQGNNITPIPTAFLMPGPYFFRVTTMYGVKSTQFYKL